MEPADRFGHQEAVVKPDLCMGLSRLFGSFGFLFVAGSIAWLLKLHWGYNSIETMGQAWHTGAKGKAIILIPSVAGLLGLAVGQGVGVAVKVKDDGLALRINILWHLIANGLLGWVCCSLTLVALKLRDRNSVTAFMKQEGMRYNFSAILIALVGCSLIAVLMWALVGSLRRTRDERWQVASLLLSEAVGVSMGVIQSHFWSLSVPVGALVGFLFPLFLLPVSNSMWQKDQALRGS